MLFCYFGHHKAATTFIGQHIVQRVAGHLGLRSDLVHSPVTFNYDLNHFITDQGTKFLLYINAQDHFVNQIQEPVKGFHVIRDPRDCIVSAYYSHRKSHPVDGWPELVEHRNNLQSLTTEEGLLAEITFSFQLLTDGIPLSPLVSMGDWNYKRPNILELKYEDMINNSDAFFLQIFQFLGLLSSDRVEAFGRVAKKVIRNRNLYTPTIGRSNLAHIISANSFSTLSDGRLPGAQNTASHYRKGIAGDHKELFTPKVKEKFIDTYPGLLQKLGYEASDDW